MKGILWGLIIGNSVGLVIGVVLAISILFCIRIRRGFRIEESSPRGETSVPVRVNGVNSALALSGSTGVIESPRTSGWSNMPVWLERLKGKNVVSACGIPKYSYKDLQKATQDFMTTIGKGAFGPVYKAQMATGETAAVKVLANNSGQGEKEFLTEVILLGRLHHRNLVNLVGFSAEKNQNMLVYVYMSNGSLASHLYGEKYEPLNWNLRVHIALDIARGLEYLHYGAVPSVVHRDIKSSNILLDHSMRARVADFGLSREEVINPYSSNVRGTFGYLDPEYMSTRTFTKRSDVYSFGVLLFELIAGRNPQQGLMEFVEFAAINTEGKVGWEEIADSRLGGKFDVPELNDMAVLAYKCINLVSRKRPSMRDIVHSLSELLKMRPHKKHLTLSAAAKEICIEENREEPPDPTISDRIEIRIDNTIEILEIC